MPSYSYVNRIAGGESDYMQPQQKNNWILKILPSVAAPGAAPSVSASGGDIWTADMELALKSMPFPESKFAKKTIRWMNQSRHYAGSFEDFSDSTIEFTDYIDKPIAYNLQKWFRLVGSVEDGTIGFAKNYKRSGALYLLPVNGGNMESGAFGDKNRYALLNGIWPTSFKLSDLDMDDTGERVLVSLTLSVDRVSFNRGASLTQIQP